MTYRKVNDLEEALLILRRGAGTARVIAGATDLFLKGIPQAVLDISSLPEATGFSMQGERFSIGAAVTHSEAAALSPVRSGMTALAEACLQVGTPQIRNLGTLGGNVVNAAPAADAAVALVALEARASVIDAGGKTREMGVSDLYTGYHQSAVDSTAEILLCFRIRPCLRGEGSAFIRFARRPALSLPLASAAARVKIDGKHLEEVSLVVAPAEPAPTRLSELEKELKGSPLSEKTWQLIEAKAARGLALRGSLLRCSVSYRRHLVGLLAAAAVREAVKRASGTGERI